MGQGSLNPMSEPLFPSGPWTGFYNYRPGKRHRMDLHLSFIRGNLSGDGVDDVGRFLIKGRYDAATCECHWTKSYLGAHDVFYCGFREGKGIWGTWEISLLAHGGFHIWPRQAGEGEAQAETEVAEEPVDAVATQEIGSGAAGAHLAGTTGARTVPVRNALPRQRVSDTSRATHRLLAAANREGSRSVPIGGSMVLVVPTKCAGLVRAPCRRVPGGLARAIHTPHGMPTGRSVGMPPA
jgi:hypothetical protein